MKDITLMPNDYIVTHIKTDTICEHFSNDDVVYVVEERIVPLVRCKECRHGTYCEEAEMYICNANDQDLYEAEHFCSYGEREGE